MENFNEIGRVLMLVGVISIFLGILITFSEKLPIIGKLPGDLYLRIGSFRFYLPLTSSILISIFLNWLINSFK